MASFTNAYGFWKNYHASAEIIFITLKCGKFDSVILFKKCRPNQHKK